MTTEQKAAVLRTLRERLIEQKERFLRYLADLDLEYAGTGASGDSAVSGNAAGAEADRAAVAVFETEQQIVSEIDAFQRLIEPLDDLYRAAYPREEGEIPPLRAALSSVQRQVLKRLEDAGRPAYGERLGSEPAESVATPASGAFELSAESAEPAEVLLANGRQLRNRDRGRSVYAEPLTPSTIDIST